MALPALTALEECSDFSKTVEPFLPQLYALPRELAQVLQRREGFVDLYASTNPLISGFAMSVLFGALFLVVAEANRNYSQIDRFWSLLPTFYIAHFNLWARLAGLPSERIDAALAFSAVWSARLTYNYARKGGYSIGSEDYRWYVRFPPCTVTRYLPTNPSAQHTRDIIRGNIPAWAFHVLNATFISFMQSILLFLIAAPVYPVLLAIQFEPGVSSADVAFVAMQLGLVLVEWFADQQQWDYQGVKKRYQSTAKVPAGCGLTQPELDRGFVASGLWAYSRHPNFAVEQTIWIFLYQWSCFATKVLCSWAAAGPTFLVLLFQGSTWFTESITAGKYPEYRHYQSKVGMFVPVSPFAYRPLSTLGPKVIRTSEIAKKQEQKKQK
ncbi:hypothetical protein RB597_004869 [Gaeumannomyces tritici]